MPLPISPEPIFRIVYGSLPAQLLKSAVALDLFSLIAAGHRTLGSLAEATGAVPRNLAILLDGLSALELLDKPNAGSYALTGVAQAHLVRGKPGYFGDFALQAGLNWDSWGRLEQVVREGAPPGKLQELHDLPEIFKQLVPQLFPLTHPHALALAAKLGAGRDWRPGRLLDVAAGTSSWGIAFAKADPDLRVTAWDFGPVLEITRACTEREGVAAQYDYLAGDIWASEPEPDAYDAAILGHICHGYGPEDNQALFRRMQRVLKPGGRLLIADFIPDDERREALIPLLFAASLMTGSPEGNTHTLAEYRDWLSTTGFDRIELIELPVFPGPILSAVRT